MCDGSNPRWPVWGQWQAPLPQSSFWLDSVDHPTIEFWDVLGPMTPMLRPLVPLAWSMTQAPWPATMMLRACVSLWKLSASASGHLRAQPCARRCHWKLGKRLRSSGLRYWNKCRTTATPELASPDACCEGLDSADENGRINYLIWSVSKISKDVQSYCFATYFVCCEVCRIFGALDELAANGCVTVWDISGCDGATGEPDALRRLPWIFKLCRQSKMRWFHCRVSEGPYTKSVS